MTIKYVVMIGAIIILAASTISINVDVNASGLTKCDVGKAAGMLRDGTCPEGYHALDDDKIGQYHTGLPTCDGSYQEKRSSFLSGWRK
jgi:hypothetical protein